MSKVRRVGRKSKRESERAAERFPLNMLARPLIGLFRCRARSHLLLALCRPHYGTARTGPRASF